MADHARSSDPAVQAQLDRLFAHGPGADVLGLDRITRLLTRLGDPHRHLPAVFHVAGTNGKGSTCAFLRAALEAAGHRVHVYTSPHLVRFNERIRVSGRLIDDTSLAPLLAEVLDAGDGIGASFFEVTTAAAFLVFAREPADACVIEVGLGGRLDATNVVADPAVCGIAALGIDHQAFLGDTLVQIAREKAGIAKRGRPLVTRAYEPPIHATVATIAEQAGAVLRDEGRWWRHGVNLRHRRAFVQVDNSSIAVPLPVLAGAHQISNLALAIAMLRYQDRVDVPLAAMKQAPLAVRWPARMQRLGPGPLTALLTPGAVLWLDGGHNADAAAAMAEALEDQARGRPATLVLGMLANKDADAMIASLSPLVERIIAVPVSAHAHHDPDALADRARQAGLAAAVAPDLPAALRQADTPVVLIAGSLYLAGEALRLNGELPD